MQDILLKILESFLWGLATPLTAVCVLPLYPGFIAFLSNQLKTGNNNKKLPILLGLTVSFGVILFMLLVGLIFTTLLQKSLTNVIGIISPIAFIILLIISVLMIFNFNFSKLIPKLKTPESKKPVLNAFLFGFFFGAIVLPCNPGIIAAFLARATLNSTANIITNLLQFLFFGIGIATPLLILAIVSGVASRQIIGFLTKHSRKINLIAGIIMFIISIYYLFFVFKIFGG